MSFPRLKSKVKGLHVIMIQDLHKESIHPAQKGDVAMSIGEAGEMLTHLSDAWSLRDLGRKIYVEYKFKNFKKALEFVNKLGVIADDAMHHPDISLGWGYVRLEIQTHSIGGLHQADFVLAAKADQIYKDI
jgi:4a-hydroxytetrahydrobiopterin dehydratase